MGWAVATASADAGIPHMTPLKAGPRCCIVTGGLASSHGICANLLPTLPPDAPFLPPRRVSTGLKMADGGDVASGAPQPTCIKVDIHQESALAKLLLSRCPLLQPHVPSPHAASRALGHRRLLVASWVSRARTGAQAPQTGKGKPPPPAARSPSQPLSEWDAYALPRDQVPAFPSLTGLSVKAVGRVGCGLKGAEEPLTI